MATITFTPADVRRLLHLKSTDDLEPLIKQQVLVIHAYTCRGRPLFTAEAVRAASAHGLTTTTSAVGHTREAGS